MTSMSCGPEYLEAPNMALRSTNIFADDPKTERLAEFFDDLYGYLLESNVPEDRLPSPWHVLSRVVRCIDPERLREWLDAYSAVEGENDEDDEEDDPEDEDYDSHVQPKPPKRRPSYLRALELPKDEEPDATLNEDEEATENDDTQAAPVDP